MKKFMQKVIMPAVFAAFVCFTLTERNEFVQRFFMKIYNQDYYIEAKPEGPDYSAEKTGQYWFVTGEYESAANQSLSTISQPQSWSSCEGEEGELLFLVIQMTEKHGKNGPDACAPEGYFHDHESVMVPEGAMHPTMDFWLKQIECTGFIVDGGPYCGFEHEGTPGVDYDFIPKLSVTYKPNLTLTVFSNLR